MGLSEDQNKRWNAMRWWNRLSSDERMLICYEHADKVGKFRYEDTLTGREIQIIYESEENKKQLNK